MGMTRSILKARDVPNYMWAEGVRHATFLINRVSTRALVNQTPYEAFKGKKPNLEGLRVFGCVAYATGTRPYLQKLDDRSTRLIYIGNEPGTKGFRLFNPRAKKIVVCRDAEFNEELG